MLMSNWVNSRLGKGIDYDKTYGVQCVDLVKDFVDNVLEVKPQSIGNAIEYYHKRNSSAYLTDNFTWHSNTPTFIPQRGDICVFTSKTGRGHVSIATGEGTTSYFYSYDQNFPRGKHEPCTKIKHTYRSFLGVLRPKNQKNISGKHEYPLGSVVVLRVNLKVRSGPSTGSSWLSRTRLSANAKAHSLNTTKAVLKAGTRVTVKDVYNENGNVWIKIPSGWIAAIYNGNTHVR